jgi:hypothetical protein
MACTGGPRRHFIQDSTPNIIPRPPLAFKTRFTGRTGESGLLATARFDAHHPELCGQPFGAALRLVGAALQVTAALAPLDGLPIELHLREERLAVGLTSVRQR